MVDGEASPEQLMALRPHLRNCPGCRATIKTLQGSSEPLSAVLPVPLMGTLVVSEDHLTNLLTRAYETVVGGFHERAIHSFTKAQGVVEAASAGKMAAVAASAAAVVGGSYATVERKVPQRGHDKPAKTAAQRPAPKASTTSPAIVTPPPPAPAVRKVTPAKPRPEVREFGTASRTTKVQSPEFAAINRQDTKYTRAAAAAPSAQSPPTSPPSPARRAPEFGGASPTPEFGG